MGMSDYHIREIESVNESWIRCPVCGTFCLICKVNLPFTNTAYHCPNPNCPTDFFDLVESFLLMKKQIEGFWIHI